MEEIEDHKEEGLILAKQGLAELGDEIDMMEKYIYDARHFEIN